VKLIEPTKAFSVNRITFPACLADMPIYSDDGIAGRTEIFTLLTDSSSASSDTLATWSIPENQPITTQGENRRNGIIRWYDPITGRWLSNDPIGISGGLNQYVFCGNNPVNFRDPFGLVELSDVDFNALWNRWRDAKATVNALAEFQNQTSDYTMQDVWAKFDQLGVRAPFTGGVTGKGKKLCDEEQKILTRFEKDTDFNAKNSTHPGALGYGGSKAQYARDWVDAEASRMTAYRDELRAELQRRTDAQKKAIGAGITQ
jgi:RHS repeat-associated protein